MFFSLSGLPIGLIVLPIFLVLPLAAMIAAVVLMVSVISALIYVSVVGDKKDRIIQIYKDAKNKHNKVFRVVGNKDKQNELMPEQSNQQQQNQQDSPKQEIINQDEIENNFS